MAPGVLNAYWRQCEGDRNHIGAKHAAKACSTPIGDNARGHLSEFLDHFDHLRSGIASVARRFRA